MPAETLRTVLKARERFTQHRRVVEAALDGTGLSAVGGACAGVGVSGLMVAGGIGMTSRRRGLSTCT